MKTDFDHRQCNAAVEILKVDFYVKGKCDKKNRLFESSLFATESNWGTTNCHHSSIAQLAHALAT